jgi:hypothetical protein
MFHGLVGASASGGKSGRAVAAEIAQTAPIAAIDKSVRAQPNCIVVPPPARVMPICNHKTDNFHMDAKRSPSEAQIAARNGSSQPNFGSALVEPNY